MHNIIIFNHLKLHEKAIKMGNRILLFQNFAFLHLFVFLIYFFINSDGEYLFEINLNYNSKIKLIQFFEYKVE